MENRPGRGGRKLRNDEVRGQKFGNCKQRGEWAELCFMARAAGMDLRVVRLPQSELRELYEAPLVLVRPDQVVAWRGWTSELAVKVIDHVLGRNIR